MTFAPIHIRGWSAHFHSAGLVSLYHADRWVGNAEFDGLHLQLLRPVPDLDMLTLQELAGAVACAPLAEWTISCPDWAGGRGFADRESAMTEFDRLAAHAKEHGGDYSVKHKGVRVTSIKKRASND